MQHHHHQRQQQHRRLRSRPAHRPSFRARAVAILAATATVFGAVAAPARADLPVGSDEDVTPPEIVAFDLTPTSVDVTTSAATIGATMTVSDDLSGVANAYLRYVSPSGQQAVFFSFHGGGTTSATLTGGATVETYREPGTWTLQTAFIQDQVGNSQIYGSAAGLGPSTFHVTGTGDLIPPDVTAVRLITTAVDVSASTQLVTAEIDVDDLGSGLSQGSMTLRSPSGTQFIRGFLWASNRISGDANSGTYLVTFQVSNHVSGAFGGWHDGLPKGSEPGEWTPGFIQVYDRAGNVHTYQNADADVLLDQPLTVTADPADVQSPTVDGFSFTPLGIDVTNASARVDVSIDVGDELAGVKAAWISFRSPTNTAASPPSVLRSGGGTYPLASPTLLDGTLTGYVNFPRYDRAGTWTVSQVCAYDWVGHLTCISGAALADLGPTELTVTDNTGLPDDPSWTVNSTGDTTDANGCTTLHCTLREAIARANATPGPQTIDFDLPQGSVVSIMSGLPALTDAGTTIDGGATGCRTESATVVDGSATTGATTGFTLLGATDVTIRGLTIRNFAGPGIFANNASHRLLVDNSTIVGNGNDGIQSQADDVTVLCNRLSGNSGFGVHFGNEAEGGRISGNVAGLAADGLTPQPNFFSGVFLRGSGTLVGGPLAGDANVLSGNRLRGIEIHGSANRVEGNLVGLAVDGVTPAGNGEIGIIMQQGGSDTTVVANHVAHNGRDGIVVSGSTSRGNTITRNSVHDNGELGIDLLANADGPDANDPGDGDSGPNGAQNMPVLTSTEVTTTATTVAGALDSTPNTTFVIEVFANPTCDPSGHGEGETFLGSFTVATDTAGLAAFDEDVPPAALGSSISVTATDQTRGETSELSACTTAEEPSNRPPTVDAGGPYTVAEGATVNLNGVTADDPDGDPLTVAWTPAGAVSDGAVLQPDVAGVDDGTIELEVTVDDGTATASDTTTVVVTNVAPTITSIAATSEPIALGNPLAIELLATDPGTADTHTWAVDWGDGTTSTATGLDADADHTYTAAGVYVVSVSISDDDGGTDADVLSGYVVVYDPDGGFVTGGGWINSPTGAYTPDDPSDPDVVGRANFGFVAKYKKGATTPTGHTEFQFQAGNLNFASTSYDWLVVAGSKALYKGVGTVNGQAGYRFLLSAIDGNKSGPDRFRIKIVELDTDVVLYDNQVGAGDDADAATVLQGGSIVIHK